MLSEREVLVSILKLTRDGPVRIGDISKDARIPSQIVRQIVGKNSNLKIIRFDGRLVTARGEQRLLIASRAMGIGADIERVCKLLTWTEFENLSVSAFEANDFTVRKHFRFSWSKRRWEIDILGLKAPIVASVDCKHWHHGWRGSVSMKAAEKQAERTKNLADASALLCGRIGIKDWKDVYFVPMILSLMPGTIKFYNNMPIVSVLQLRDFLQKMPAHVGEVKHFHVRLG